MLTFTITDALDKKQNILPPQCENVSDELQRCQDAADNLNKDELCSGTCKSAVTDYLNDCFGGLGVNEFNQQYDQACSAAGTVVTLFTVISSFLIAVGN